MRLTSTAPWTQSSQIGSTFERWTLRPPSIDPHETARLLGHTPDGAAALEQFVGVATLWQVKQDREMKSDMWSSRL